MLVCIILFVFFMKWQEYSEGHNMGTKCTVYCDVFVPALVLSMTESNFLSWFLYLLQHSDWRDNKSHDTFFVRNFI